MWRRTNSVSAGDGAGDKMRARKSIAASKTVDDGKVLLPDGSRVPADEIVLEKAASL